MTAEELDNKIIFKNGDIEFTDNFSIETRETYNCICTFLSFENIKYIDFEKSNKETELELILFIKYKNSTKNKILSTIFGKKWLFKDLVGKKIKLAVNPELDYNENSIYINYGHTPIDVPYIEFQKINKDKIEAIITLVILGKFEDTIERNLLTTKKVELIMKT